MFIQIGQIYTFRSTQISNGYADRDKQAVKIISCNTKRKNENLYSVEFPDGFIGKAYEGELNGYFENTKQTIDNIR